MIGKGRLDPRRPQKLMLALSVVQIVHLQYVGEKDEAFFWIVRCPIVTM